jgi:acetyl-CoA carboxylase alpha subunit
MRRAVRKAEPGQRLGGIAAVIAPENTAAVLYRSPLRARCEERALVLTALGLASLVDFDGLD